MELLSFLNNYFGYGLNRGQITLSTPGLFFLFLAIEIQCNLNGSNPDGSFTVDDSNTFFSPYKILPIAQENKYLGIFFLILSWNCILCVLIRIASSRRF